MGRGLLLERLRDRLLGGSLVLLVLGLALGLELLLWLALRWCLLLVLVGLQLALRLLLEASEGRPELRPEVCQLGLLGTRRIRLGLQLAGCLGVLLPSVLVVRWLAHCVVSLPLG